MFPLLALGLVAYLIMSSEKKGESGGPHISNEGPTTTGQGWSLLLQGPAALPQTAIPEILRQIGVQSYVNSKTFLASPRPGYNVLTMVTPDVVLAQTGKVLTVMGVPLTVAALTPAPIG